MEPDTKYVIFEAIRGGNEMADPFGDIAIDDIIITEGVCKDIESTTSIILPTDIGMSSPVSPTEGISPTGGISPTEGVSPTGGISPTEGVSPTDGISVTDGVSATDGVSLTDGISVTDGVSPTDNTIPTTPPVTAVHDGKSVATPNCLCLLVHQHHPSKLKTFL